MFWKSRSLFLMLFFAVSTVCAQTVGNSTPEIGVKENVQNDTDRNAIHLYKGFVALEGIATTNKQVPFWMRANRYGSMPLPGVSASVLAGFSREQRPVQETLIDWGFALQGRMNVSSGRSQFQLIEAAINGRFSIFQLKAGRSKDIMGLVDSTMSTGAFAISGNALGIPKVELSVPEYWSLPLTKGLLSFKGNFALGYVGVMNLRLARPFIRSKAQTLYHQKSLYGRLGNERWKVKFYGGFNHHAFWGGEQEYYPGWSLSKVQTAIKAITGTKYKSSKIGNQIGSIDQAIEVEFKKFQVRGYHQFFYDVGGLYHLNNIKDGLWGLVITNKQEGRHRFRWEKILIEILNSKSQGGELDAKPTPSGDENYYNNGVYPEGWSYQGDNLGNPLFTNRNYAREELPSRVFNFVTNNRVTALHIGTECTYDQWSATLLLTGSSNLGTWWTSPISSSNGSRRYPPGPPPYFEEVFQFSGYLEASRPVGDGFRLGFALAVDQGNLLYNSVGGLVKLSRSL